METNLNSSDNRTDEEIRKDNEKYIKDAIAKYKNALQTNTVPDVVPPTMAELAQLKNKNIKK